MNTSAPACGCGRPLVDNELLCRRCTARLEQDLAEIPSLVGELETTRLRQSRTGGQAIGGGHSTDRPLPYDERPVAAAKALLEVLRTWTQVVVEQRGKPCPRDSLADLARFLLGQLDWLRRRDTAAEFHDELGRAVSRVRYSIDRRAERVYAGPCGSVEYDDATGEPKPDSVPCPADLYGRPNARTVTCGACATVHDTADRRQWLLAAVEDQLGYGALLSKALSNLGRPVPEATFRSWVSRGRLLPHGQDEQGRDVYRVGDVLDLLAQDAAAQARRGSKKAG